MQQEERNSINIQLMDGLVVDVCTESGANAFLQAGSTIKNYLSENVEFMSKICAKRRLNAKDKGDLLAMNCFFASIFQYGSRDVFGQHVQQSTVKAWLDHLIQQIKRFTTNRNWITTGKLQRHDSSLLESCVSMMFHAVPVALAFESDFFNVLADFVKVRKGTGRALPCAEICDTVALIVSYSYHTSRLGFDNTWATEKALKKLEATGILEQFIRCATVPQPSVDRPALFRMLDEFQTCSPFLSKKVRPGQPCGDVVIAILEGRDGSRVQRPSIINILRTMIRFASSVNPEHDCGDLIKMCQNCRKSKRPELLMKCGRCQLACYCSKECQKADWKTHKKMCFHKTKEELVMSENIQQTFSVFCRHQYSHIMVKMVEACEQTGLSKSDMLVELNFWANGNGIVPAMQDKPEFKVAPVKDYIEGSRPAEPDWSDRNYTRKLHEYNIKPYLAGMLQQIDTQPNEILCMVRYEGGLQCFTVGWTDTFTNKGVFSQEAVQAFKAYMKDDDVGPLSAMFHPGYLQKLKVELAVHYGYGVVDLVTAIRTCEEGELSAI